MRSAPLQGAAAVAVGDPPPVLAAYPLVRPESPGFALGSEAGSPPRAADRRAVGAFGELASGGSGRGIGIDRGPGDSPSSPWSAQPPAIVGKSGIPTTAVLKGAAARPAADRPLVSPAEAAKSRVGAGRRLRAVSRDSRPVPAVGCRLAAPTRGQISTYHRHHRYPGESGAGRRKREWRPGSTLPITPHCRPRSGRAFAPLCRPPVAPAEVASCRRPRVDAAPGARPNGHEQPRTEVEACRPPRSRRAVPPTAGRRCRGTPCHRPKSTLPRRRCRGPGSRRVVPPATVGMRLGPREIDEPKSMNQTGRIGQSAWTSKIDSSSENWSRTVAVRSSQRSRVT